LVGEAGRGDHPDPQVEVDVTEWMALQCQGVAGNFPPLMKKEVPWNEVGGLAALQAGGIDRILLN
jgi:hypothetical protein